VKNLQALLDAEKEKNALLLDIINAIPDPIFAKNWDGNFIFVNKKLAELYNTTPETMIGKEDSHFTGNIEQAKFFKENVQAIMKRFETEEVFEQSTDAKTGQIRHFHSLKLPFRNNAKELNIAVIAKDVTELTSLKNVAEASAKRLKYVLEVSGEGLWDWHPQSNQVLHNSEWERITGIERSDNSFAEFQNCLFPEDRPRVNERLTALKEKNTPYDIEFRMRRPDGKEIWIWDRGQVVERDSNGNPVWIVGIMLDVTKSKQDQAKINFMAFYDALTLMPNRSLLEDRLKQAMEHAKRSEMVGALLFIDLDQFKTLNDTHGHQSGDDLLIQVANRIHKILKPDDTLARFGGDEFVVILNDLDDNEINAAHKAELKAIEIRQHISQPIFVKTNHRLVKTEFQITASIGVTLFDKHCQDTQTLLQLSDLALYQAKAKGRDNCVFYDPKMQQELTQTMVLETELRAAIAQQSFMLYYQAQCDNQQNIVSAEALIRWVSPSRGLLLPGEFIDFAEDSNFILPIGKWVISQACKQLQTWQHNPSLQNLKVSVNVSPKQIWHPSFVEQTISLVQEYDIPASNLVLEITESVLLKDMQETIPKIAQLRNFGIKISLDDFGTGYSSLGYLKNLPIDELKIDKSFINDITSDNSDLIMVKTILDLGKNFNLSVVSEGVETAAQQDLLKSFGCNLYQGYYYSKPLPVDEFEALVTNRSKCDS